MSKSGWIRSLAVVDPECSYHNQMYLHEIDKNHNIQNNVKIQPISREILQDKTAFCISS